MNETYNQNEMEAPIVEELVPTDFAEAVESEPDSGVSQSYLTLLDPDNLETVLSIDSFSGASGTTVTVPIAISDAEGLQSLQVNLTYDTSILTINDPNEETIENEGVRRAGISANWESDINNPIAGVDPETGEVSISLINTTGELPQPSEEGNPTSRTILEIDFQINEDAELDSVADINLQEARVGIEDRDIVVGEDNLDNGDVTVDDGTTIELFRFRNIAFDTGTYVFVGAAERDSIESNPDFNQTFELDGRQEDGTVNAAFTASTVPGENLIPFYRLRSLDVEGTFLFVSTDELNAIFAEDSDQRDKWQREGFDETGETDIPEFYLLDGSADSGTEFNRFQNNQNNTFLYAGPAESQAIADDPNLNSLFTNQGVAFESLA